MPVLLTPSKISPSPRSVPLRSTNTPPWTLPPAVTFNVPVAILPTQIGLGDAAVDPLPVTVIVLPAPPDLLEITIPAANTEPPLVMVNPPGPKSPISIFGSPVIEPPVEITKEPDPV